MIPKDAVGVIAPHFAAGFETVGGYEAEEEWHVPGGNPSSPVIGRKKTAELVWKSLSDWSFRVLRFPSVPRCRITLMPEDEMVGAWGLYFSGSREVWVRKDAAVRQDRFVSVLSHEFIHYIHHQSVSDEDWRNCPKVYREGIAQIGAEAFLDGYGWNIPSHLQRPPGPLYAMGRVVVRQIASEGYGLQGFARSFLHDVPPDSPWRQLDGKWESSWKPKV